MPQSSALITTLKRALKSQGKTYADVAVCLDLSEGSVKRLFSDQHFSLLRLEKICAMLDLELSDLVQAMLAQQNELQQLSVEQEKVLTQDLILLLITVCVLNKWRMHEIMQHYSIEEHECIQKLAVLDKLKIIDLLPGNKIKLKIAANFNWIEGGPIQSFFQEKIAQEFFNTRFKNDNESLTVLHGMLSKQSNGELQRKLKRLAREFEDLNQDDSTLPLKSKEGVTMVLALRGWEFGLFANLKK